MENKQEHMTAVQWFYDQIKKADHNDISRFYKEALARERAQLEEEWDKGYFYGHYGTVKDEQ